MAIPKETGFLEVVSLDTLPGQSDVLAVLEPGQVTDKEFSNSSGFPPGIVTIVTRHSRWRRSAYYLLPTMETTPRSASFSLLHAAVLLFALSSAACGTAAEPPRADDAGSVTAMATVDELMQAIVVPASDALFDAVVYSNGALEKAPATPEEWSQLRLQALALAEAGTLLKLPERAMGRADWVELSSAMSDEAVGFARAAESKDLDGVLQAGSAVYRTCVACHEKYVTD